MQTVQGPRTSASRQTCTSEAVGPSLDKQGTVLMMQLYSMPHVCLVPRGHGALPTGWQRKDVKIPFIVCLPGKKRPQQTQGKSHHREVPQLQNDTDTWASIDTKEGQG